MKKYKALLFDCDGTLIDTEDLVFRSFEATLRQLFSKNIDRKTVQNNFGLPLKTQFEKFTGVDDDAVIQTAIEKYSDYQKGIIQGALNPFPGVREGLEQLYGKVPLAVVTSRRRISLLPMLAGCGLEHFFNFTVCPEDTGRHKPDPEPAFFALEKLDLRADEVLFIGDSVFDSLCAHGAGMDFALVAWTGIDAGDLDRKPELKIKQVGDLDIFL
jgi:pyrophosphatase PpaX